MAYDYGYGDLVNKLIDLFRSGAPDFESAEELLRQGADINAAATADDNILSEILSRYSEVYEGNDNESFCNDCEHYHLPNPDAGPAMCSIIRFFLDHGFDVNKCDGCFGAQCLCSLTFSTFDRYMIEATKLLLDAGAKDRSISPQSPDEDETPWDFITIEGSYQRTLSCEHAHVTANIYEAVSQIYQAVKDGRPYSGIDSYELAIGKKIQRVLAEKNGDQPIFYSMNLPEFKKDNCFTQTLYFIYDGGMLISTPYSDFWTDTVLPHTDLVDVSKHFEGIVGNTIRNFIFDRKSVVKNAIHYRQPITTIEMDSGYGIRLSINFGEVEREDFAAFYDPCGN